MRVPFGVSLRLAAAALVLAATAAGAEAQGRSKYGAFTPPINHVGQPGPKPPAVVVQQKGDGNGSSASQFGIGNLARVIQKGDVNLGTILQSGDDNYASVRQFGNKNTGAINQTGSDNAACLIQIGRKLDGQIVQTGGQSTGVIQTRKGNVEFPAELCMLEEASRGFWMKTSKGK